MAQSVQNSSEWGCRGEGDDGLVSGLQLTKGPFNLHCTAAWCLHIALQGSQRGRGGTCRIYKLTKWLPVIWYLQIAPSDQVTSLQPVSAQSDRIHITHCKEAGKEGGDLTGVIFLTSSACANYWEKFNCVNVILLQLSNIYYTNCDIISIWRIELSKFWYCGTTTVATYAGSLGKFLDYGK